jgi:hypothetical protein
MLCLFGIVTAEVADKFLLAVGNAPILIHPHKYDLIVRP